MTHRDVFDQLTAHLEAKQRAAAERVIDFDDLSREAWRELNITHAKKRSSVQFHVAMDVAYTIDEMFKDMAKEALPHASYGTKRNAVETMRKIFKSILLSEGSELRKVVFQNVNGLPKIMKTVLEGFNEDQLYMLVNQEFEGKWLDKLRELIRYSESYGTLEDLQDILAFCERAAVSNKQ